MLWIDKLYQFIVRHEHGCPLWHLEGMLFVALLLCLGIAAIFAVGAILFFIAKLVGIWILPILLLLMLSWIAHIAIHG